MMVKDLWDPNNPGIPDTPELWKVEAIKNNIPIADFIPILDYDSGSKLKESYWYGLRCLWIIDVNHQTNHDIWLGMGLWKKSLIRIKKRMTDEQSENVTPKPLSPVPEITGASRVQTRSIVSSVLSRATRKLRIKESSEHGQPVTGRASQATQHGDDEPPLPTNRAPFEETINRSLHYLLAGLIIYDRTVLEKLDSQVVWQH